jgi:O-6-methylguanine DNA methyltransferase
MKDSFTRRVYKAVLKIPLGEVRTYQWVAKRAGNPKAARAVGQILKRNPYPLLIPCHRVVPSTGGTGGYRLGPKKKAALLNLERLIRKTMV